MGFAAIAHPSYTNTFVCTQSQAPTVVMERLSKDIEKKAIGPARLIESSMEVVYRKILTGWY
jgi:methionine synthase I (cobalamin-dependent)